MEVLSPLEQSILHWDSSCDDKTVDGYETSLTMNGSCHENGEAYINDQTFHTPSFGDEEFDIPPIHLPPTSASDSSSNDLYGCTQPLTHHHQGSQQQETSQQQQQQHMLPPSPPLSQHSPQPPPPCSQTVNQQQTDRGMVMAAVSSSPPTMTSYVDVAQQQQQQQQNRYQGPGPMNNNQVELPQDLYMVQLGDSAMMPPQSVHFQVQSYNMPPNYSNAHLDQVPRMTTHPHHQQYRFASQGHPQMGMHQLHQIQQQQHHHQSMMGVQSPSMFSLQLNGPQRQARPGSVGSSPPGSNHTSPGLETSEDSDDSGHLGLLMGGIKRPSPEPVERPPSGGKSLKRPKTQKKKKKRDPNEPQKPVSAYALFFRDTQAAIKGQNPNASFGEVSKIVASMWDGLEIDHKNVYKRKTEAAKKEYLKALAAYRASLVSKAANDQSDNIYGNSAPGPPVVTSSSPMTSSNGPSPLQKKSPLLTSLMEGTSPITSLHNMTQPQPLLIGQGNMASIPQQHMIQQGHAGGSPQNQMLHQMLSPGGHMVHMIGQHPMAGHPGGQQQQRQQQQQQQNIQMNNNMAYTTNMMPSPNQMAGQASPGNMMCSPPPQMQNCILRNPNDQQQQQQQQQQQPTPDWERDFVNNDCVVSHCRDVYSTWVASRPPAPNSYASVK